MEEQCAFVVRETQEADDENLKTGLCYFAKEMSSFPQDIPITLNV